MFLSKIKYIILDISDGFFYFKMNNKLFFMFNSLFLKLLDILIGKIAFVVCWYLLLWQHALISNKNESDVKDRRTMQVCVFLCVFARVCVCLCASGPRHTINFSKMIPKRSPGNLFERAYFYGNKFDIKNATIHIDI